ncbi:unnamed protein product [Boreogadus saida]
MKKLHSWVLAAHWSMLELSMCLKELPRGGDSHYSDIVDKKTKCATKCLLIAPLLSGKELIVVVMALNKPGAK